MNDSINIKDRIHWGEDLSGLRPLLEGRAEIFLVCDTNLWYGTGKTLADALGERLKGVKLLQASEKNKTLETVEGIISSMLEAGLSRGAFLLAVGGGITTDIAGFAASVYKRGIPFGFVPTTLLSQVDAAIGGKNGVNFGGLKNMVGVIRQSEFTYICPSFLSTLPREILLEGAAELLKTFIIADAEAYTEAVELFSSFAGTRSEAPANGAPMSQSEFFKRLGLLSRRAALIKAEIVERDPEEHGLRRVLNLGHTFAHAIESLSAGEWSHGDAVAVGTVMAARLSESLSGKVDLEPVETALPSQPDESGETARSGKLLCKKGLAARLEADFKAVGLPTECPYPPEALSGAMAQDKKADGGMINFVLPVEVGSVRIVKLSPDLGACGFEG